MNAFRLAAAVRPAAAVLAFVVTFAMFASVNTLSRHEYRQAVDELAAATSAPALAALAGAPSTKGA